MLKSSVGSWNLPYPFGWIQQVLRGRRKTQRLIHREYLAALQEISLSISEAEELPVTLAKIVEKTTKLVGASMGRLFLVPPNTNKLEAVVNYNLPRNDLGSTLRFGEGLVGIVAETSLPSIIPDYSRWSGRLSIYKGMPFRSMMGVPIKWQGEVIGVLNLIDERTDLFTTADLELASSLADQAALAIVHWRLHNHVQQEASERETVLQSLKKLETHFSAVFRGSPIGISITALDDGRYVDVNDAFLDFVGFKREEVVGRTVYELNLWEDFSQRSKAIQTLHQQGYLRDFEAKFRSKTGEVRATMSSVELLELDGKKHILGMFHDITDRRQAETALQQSEARNSALIRAVPDLMFLLNKDGYYLDYYTPHPDLLYVSPSDFMGKRMADVLPPALASAFEVKLQEALESGELTILEYPLPMPEGIGYFEARIAAFDMDKLLVIIRDVTERKRIETAEREQRILAEALRDTASALNSTLKLDAVLDRILTQVALVVPHDASTVMIINGGMVEIIRQRGHIEHGLSEKSIAERRAIDDTPLLQSMIVSGQAIAIPDVRENPKWRYFNEESMWIRSYVGATIKYQDELLGLINLDSGTTGMFTPQHAERLQAFADQAGIAIQNARHAAELEARVAQRTFELEMQRKQLQTILDATGEGIFYTEGRHIQYVNRAFLDMMGYESSEVIGKSAAIFRTMTADVFVRNMMQSLPSSVAGREAWRDEVKLRRKDGTEFDAGLTVSLLGEPTDQPLRAVTIIRDISKEKELDAQKARFIANAAHELSSPISSLNLRLTLMRKFPDEVEEHLDLLGEISKRMKKLVEDLLDISRFEHGLITLQQKHTTLQTLLDSVIRLHSSEAQLKRIKLNYEPSAEPLPVFVDPDRVIQVITNLVTNAIHYTPEGGYIEITTGIEHGRIDYGMVCIKDTGTGIPAEHLPHIFQPFFRADHSRQGTGLGLSISKEIIELHEGEIHVESTVGVGSEFIIKLPIVPMPLKN